MQQENKGFIRKGFSENLHRKNIQAVSNAVLSIKVTFLVSFHMILFPKSSGSKGFEFTTVGKCRIIKAAERQGTWTSAPSCLLVTFSNWGTWSKCLCFTSVGFSFLICKLEIMIIITS